MRPLDTDDWISKAKALPREEKLKLRIADLPLNLRAINGLTAENLLTVGDVIRTPDRHLKAIKRFGAKSLQEVKVLITGTLDMPWDPFTEPELPLSPSPQMPEDFLPRLDRIDNGLSSINQNLDVLITLIRDMKQHERKNNGTLGLADHEGDGTGQSAPGPRSA
jgi:hypothetical protein